MPERIRDAVMSFGVHENYRKIAPDELHIPIANMTGYIKGVRVHPQSYDWYANLIERLCEQHRLRYLGKSDLYRTVAR